MLNIKRKNQKGVSLVELIVVMAILAILASIAIVSYTVFIKRAKLSKAEQELTQVYNLIYMEANEKTIEIGQNNNLETSLFVTTSGNKIVLIFNDVPTKTLGSEFEFNNIDHWLNEEHWNQLLNELIDKVTGDIGMFTGKFLLDSEEETATLNPVNNHVTVNEVRHITYILENDQELSSKKELIVSTLNDVETVIRFLSEIEGTKGRLVPKGRVSNDLEVEEINYEVWFVWEAAAGYVLSNELIGTTHFSYEISIVSDTLTEEELISANNLINGNGNIENRLFTVEVIYQNTTITTGFADVVNVKVRFNREPYNQEEYNLIQNNEVRIDFIINISDIQITYNP